MIPISLTELTASAANLTRVDRKYVVPVTALPDLAASLPESTRILQIDNQHEFAYTSTYLDTPALASYYLAGTRRRRRFKVRTRTYGSGDSFLEVKVRGARDRNVKERIEFDESLPLSPDSLMFIDGTLHAAGVHGVLPDELSPSLTTRYHRTTLLLPDDAARVTVDRSLTCSRRGQEVSFPRMVIVETKAPSGRPTVMDMNLWRAGFRPVKISKYGIGMALTTPDLPLVKWHRALTHDIPDAMSA